MSSGMKVPKGLAGVSVTETSISKSDADGSLVYRGYPISEITANARYEETAYLILNGSLPTRSQLEAFSSDLAEKMQVDGRVFGIMRDLGKGALPIDALRTATSALGSLDDQRSIGGQQASIEAKMAVLAANCHRVPNGERLVEPKKGLDFASNLLQMLTTKEASEYERWAFERVLMLYMEHDLNASSFTVRVVASTLADPYAAASAGLAALKGPLHGGANEVAMQMLLDVGEPEKAAKYVDRSLKEGKKVIGFGHRVYKKFDPRAVLCKEYLREILKRRGGDDKLFRVADSLEKEIWERKGIPPNLDYYAAPIFYLLGIEIPLYTPIFAASRVFGWMAHYNEQMAENKLIRPDATYVGPDDLKYVPLDERS
ncbi:MAG: citrate synthase [Thaumarchaeota archaeon]|nr:citrate synthase [Nitrososphaerota archaeon]